jgi:flagellar basal-body rod protein FlgB
MPDLIKNDVTARLLEKALDGLSLRQKAITNNVANVDTPNFKSSEVTFEQDLQAAIRRGPASDELALTTTSDLHIGNSGRVNVDDVRPRSTQLLHTSLRNDGNNVDIDREMTRLAETQLFFQTATQLVNVKFNQLKTAIWEGKK